MSYAIIDVNNDYDTIESLKCIKVVPTEEEAKAFIKQENEDCREKHKTYWEYLEKFVLTIEPTEVNIKKYFVPHNEVSVSNFHHVMKYRLNDSIYPPVEGFNPPAKPNYYNLYYVELPLQERGEAI
jgi:hypothetical protein